MRKVNQTSKWVIFARISLLVFFLSTVITIFREVNNSHTRLYYPSSMFGTHLLGSWWIVGFSRQGIAWCFGISEVIHCFLYFLQILGLPDTAYYSILRFLMELPKNFMSIPTLLLLLVQLGLFLVSFKKPTQAFRLGALLYALDTVVMIVLYFSPFLFASEFPFNLLHRPESTDASFFPISFFLLIVRFAMVAALVWATIHPVRDRK